MKTFTKTCILALVLFFSSSLIAQQSINNNLGTKAPDKMELIQLNHGPTENVPYKPAGSSKAVGDDCGTPITVGALPFNDNNQYTTGRGPDYSNTCLNDFDGGEDIVYEITLAAETTIQVTIDPKGTKHTGMALNDDCFDSPSATCLAVATDIWGDGDPYSFIVTLTAGTYWLMVDTWPNPTSIADFDLTIAEAGTAPNDECINAVEIGEVTNYVFSTELATGAGTTCTGGANIWYKYTASFTGDAIVDLCGSLYNTELGVYDACGGTSLACGTDECDLQSKVEFSVTNGDSYWIEIGGYHDGISADRGDGFLSIYEKEDCPITCSGTPEGEACGADLNGGCNMASPDFISPADSVDICGNLWADGGERDTDWFEVVLSAVSDVTFTVEAEENVVIGLVGQVVPGVAGCANTTDFLSEFELVPACQPGFIEIKFMAPGTYYFFLAPQVYADLICPGFDYKANLDFVTVDKGTISGTVTDGTNPIEGVPVSADIYSDVTDIDGNYSFDVPPGTYDVTANGFTLGYSTEESLDEVVTKDNTTDVDFVLTDEQAPFLLNAFGSFNHVKLNWTEMVKGGFKSLAGGLESDNDYTPSSTMDLDFTLTVYSWDLEWADFFSMTFPAGFSINTGTALNGITATVSGQTITWDGSFYTETFPEEITFSVNVDVAGISGPQSIDFSIEGDEGSEVNAAVTVYEDGGAYVPTFNVYRKLNIPGTTFIPIAYGVIGNEYLDEVEDGEWCYFVTQILADKTETVASNSLCAEVLDYCTNAIDYGIVNDPVENYTLQFVEEVAWFKFEVPYMMDVMVSTCGSDFNTQFAIYEDCADFTGTLPVDAFSHITDGCGDQATENYKYLSDGTYYIAVWGEAGEFGEIELEITQIQMFCILENWSGYSIYMNPTPSSVISTVLADVADNMIISIRQTPYGIWWPPQNINTIGNISPLIGYKAKATALDCTVINGTEEANKTVTLPQGASYLPVRVSYPVDITELFNPNPAGNDLLIVYDMHTNSVFWPLGGITTEAGMDTLWPGTAYLVNMITAGTRTYPGPAKNSNPVTPPSFEYKQGKTIWNEVKLTGNPHFISIGQEALVDAVKGDFIGVFDANGYCVGLTEYNCDACNLFIAANADDEYTTSKDGLAVGEKMSFRLYRPSTGAEYGLTPTYSTEMPNQDGLFQINGMSRINEFKLGPTAIIENQLSNVSIYPNPSNGTLTISGIGTSVDIIVTNAQGQETYSGNVNNNALLDLSAQPKGIYFIKLMTENSIRIEKVVLK